MNIPDGPISVVVLGIAQDAGVPHAGCCCSRCQAAFANPALSLFSASIAIVDARVSPAKVWLVDATPDVKYQLNMLRDVLGPHYSRPDRLREPNGVFLTHAHMGHIAGLVHFGPEAMAVQGLRVCAPDGLVTALRSSPIWSPLLGCLELESIEPGRPVELSAGLTVEPVPVPHRDEVGSGTFAYKVISESQTLLYLPDIDGWDRWPEAVQVLSDVDIALVDATFFNQDEIPGREPVSHPSVVDTLMRFRDLPTLMVLTHLNHTNPLLDFGSEERRLVEANGMEVAFQGQVFEL